ncbi:MAG: DUF4358 domain-containing protein [Lachnospiraceae bacterium]|nr:DUF4358 domain-containing protein [Lachnospiraceae bacterium]
MNKKSNIRSNKKVGKSIICLAILILMTGAAGLSGCGNNENKNRDRNSSLKAEAVFDSCPDDLQLDKILEKLTENNIFEGEMAKVSPAAVLESYGLKEGKDDTEIYVSYMSTAARADEITVIKSSNLKDVESLAQQYIDKRKKSFESYKPEEVKKLDDYLTVAYGGDSGIYILCVCSDKKAALSLIEAESVH